MEINNEQLAALTEVIRSEGWEVIRNEILEPLRQELWTQLREVKFGGPVTPEMGAEAAAKLRALDKFLDRINDLLGK